MNKLITSSVAMPYEQRYRSTPHRYDLIFTDFILLNTMFLMAAQISYTVSGFISISWNNVLLALVVNVTWVALSLRYESYRWYEKLRMEDELRKIIKIFTFHFAILTVCYYHVLGHQPSPTFFIMAYALSGSSIVVGRVYHHVRQRSSLPRFRYVVVGGKLENLRSLERAFGFAFQGNAEMIGRFGSTVYQNVTNIGSYEDIIPFLEKNPPIDKLVFFYSDLAEEQEKEIVRICGRQFIDIEVVPGQVSIFPRGHKAQKLGDLTILTVKEEPLALLRNKFVKRTCDIIFSGLVLLFIFPPMFLIVSFLIKRESKGPVFFLQERSGYLNRQFKMIKFRTMTVNSDSDTKQATAGDARVTKIGAFLRANSLDEFPQFINVFLGDMSVVGPRPHMLQHTHQYSQLIKPYMIRHKIKPGVTGWAQVNGYRGPTDELWKMEKRVEFDVSYLENWSLLLDIQCVYATIFNAIEGEENAL